LHLRLNLEIASLLMLPFFFIYCWLIFIFMSTNIKKILAQIEKV